MTAREMMASPAALAAHAALNATVEDYPHQPVGELFARQAAQRPDHPAICCGQRVITYRELHDDARQLAHTLLDRGAAPGEVIAVALPRGPEMITAALAILLCGASYLPIDVRWPPRRIRELLDAAQTRQCIANSDALRSQLSNTTVLDITAQPRPGATSCTLPAVSPDAIAYINFTSGSTGRPKGVPIRHRSISRLVFATRYVNLPPGVRVLHLAPVTFDAATFEIWGPLLRGGVCVIYPDPFIRVVKLGRIITTHRVDVVFVTTALFNTIIDDAPEIFDRVETILTGGEAHSIRHMRRALQRYGPGRVVSVYGPTESTTFATYYPINRLAADTVTVPIGRPIQNTRAYLIDEDRLCAVGDIGALHLAGPGLTPGYLGLPERTNTDFIDARIDTVNERLYHTGDLAYLDDHGQLVFCGRSDDQLKINGFRIELGEVRHHIDALPAVRASYVTVYETCPGQRALAAFMVAHRPELAAGLADAVHDHLATHLPGYMIPKMLAVVDELPLGDTGKVSRAALLSSTEAAGT